MYEIAKTFEFSAGHYLPQLPDGHKCKRPHGHNYAVTFVLRADVLDGRGFVVDYGELDPVKRYLDQTLDHRDLNEVLFPITTAEAIARHLYRLFKPDYPALYEVRVSETPKTWAAYHE